MRIILSLLILLTLAPSAHAVSVVRGDGTPYPSNHRVVRWINAMKVQTTSVAIEIAIQPCYDARVAPTRACAQPGRNTIWIPRDQVYRDVLYHEMGHLYDFGMEQGMRDWFALVLNDPRGWREGSAEEGKPPLNEWFADFYAACAMGVSAPPSRTGRVVRISGYGALYMRLQDYQEGCRKLRYHTNYSPLTLVANPVY